MQAIFCMFCSLSVVHLCEMCDPILHNARTASSRLLTCRCLKSRRLYPYVFASFRLVKDASLANQ